MYLSIFAAPCPKRFETTFTSSGCETSLGIFRRPFCACTAAVVGEDFRYALSCQIIMKIVVHLDCGSPATCADAFHFFEREDTIRRYAFVSNTEFFLKLLVYVVSAAQHATDVGADLHIELARRLEAQHRGERR